MEHCKRFPSMNQAAAALEPPANMDVLSRHLQRIGRHQEVKDHHHGVPTTLTDGPHQVFDEQVRKLVGRKAGATVEEVADKLDVSPRKVREAFERLRGQGYRVPDDPGGDVIRLEPVNPDKKNLHRSLLEGSEAQVGLVSDTHLSSMHEALDELELAYDVFVDRGITEVLHAGDWTCGYGIYRTQATEVKNHTYDTQVDYLAEFYPRRDSITTRGISGNHDIEGEFGKLGANPVAALAHRRDDIEFLGDYSAWVNYGSEKHPCWVHLLHGSGGMSYSYSYKAQKLVDGYPAGKKPAVLGVGHWHVAGHINQRSVNVIWPACFEWQSNYLKRKGLAPAVGFYILHMTIGKDGSLVRFIPEWFQLFEGREVVAA